jgi:hypothetical protein
VGGFESGGENNTSTLECRVVSTSPHSQGESNFKIKLKIFLFPFKENCMYADCIVISNRERKLCCLCAENPIKKFYSILYNFYQEINKISNNQK